MEWVLIFFFIIFLIFNFILKKHYEEKNSGVGTGHDRQFDEYLQQIDGYYDLYSKRRYVGDNRLDLPHNWQKALRSRRENIVRGLSYCFFGIYIFITIILIKHDSIIINITALKSLVDYISIMSHFSIVPVLVWLWRRSHYDGLTQGYLYGYVDALEKANNCKTDSA